MVSNRYTITGADLYQRRIIGLDEFGQAKDSLSSSLSVCKHGKQTDHPSRQITRIVRLDASSVCKYKNGMWTNYGKIHHDYGALLA